MLIGRVVDTARALMEAVTMDDSGKLIGAIYQGGNGGLLSNETIMCADEVRRMLDLWDASEAARRMAGD